MSLRTFLEDNRQEIIKRTRARVAGRTSPQPNETEMEHGVPIFLTHLVDALRAEEKGAASHDLAKPHGASQLEQSAALHGEDLRKFGFSIEQVVRDYGDVCQAVTELALEQHAPVTIAEFHTLNRCLDDAIAAAVTSWSDGREKLPEGMKERKKERSEPQYSVRRELQGLVDTASISLDVLEGGVTPIGGSTGMILRQCLVRMREIVLKMP